ncbi:Uncharacterised protein [uncultured Eubacterium sp.]|uniref:type III toxin-antitoxin system ToxN/AbiQ family toxin n=1 Tax=Brotomerdimonas butyrica TaxID=2981721 RepID=UPI000821D969|nr:type III toxin-antitoxin system ToxN/AbiQ family toxin [Brotomerdimonas butyrica]MCU6756394.1 type III toxin-antitoxin system ToxN/AbiQ family toxin [Brotomerdimonas butyrica]SCH81880.1 Uncharacterised protein [uncultured Eubacterium sp.]
MNWYVVDKDYVKHLSETDPKVGYVEYGDRLKLHIGILLDINGINYYVPVSSPKEKHNRMNNSIDFHKLVDAHTGQLYAVININNMIPVPEKYAVQLKYNTIDDFRLFADATERTNYIYLLQKEKALIDAAERTLKEKARKLYAKCTKNPDSKLAKRCCDFIALEKACREYK